MNTNFIVIGLTQPQIEPESTVSVADALSTERLKPIGCLKFPIYCIR